MKVGDIKLNISRHSYILSYLQKTYIQSRIIDESEVTRFSATYRCEWQVQRY